MGKGAIAVEAADDAADEFTFKNTGDAQKAEQTGTCVLPESVLCWAKRHAQQGVSDQAHS